MERHQRIRLIWLVGTWVVVEVLLWLLGRRAPALADLTGLGYWLALIAFAIPVGRALRKRAGADRRRNDRRTEQETPS
jgi:hypothetical protein